MAEIIEKGTKLIGKCVYCDCIYSYKAEEIQFINNNSTKRGRRILKVKCPQCEMLTPVKLEEKLEKENNK